MQFSLRAGEGKRVRACVAGLRDGDWPLALGRVVNGTGAGHLLSTIFQNLQMVVEEFKGIFDIDIFESFKREDIQFAKIMFYRRHVYEHKGGEADEKYIAESGDSSVRPKPAIRES